MLSSPPHPLNPAHLQIIQLGNSIADTTGNMEAGDQFVTSPAASRNVSAGIHQTVQVCGEAALHDVAATAAAIDAPHYGCWQSNQLCHEPSCM